MQITLTTRLKTRAGQDERSQTLSRGFSFYHEHSTAKSKSPQNLNRNSSTQVKGPVSNSVSAPDDRKENLFACKPVDSLNSIQYNTIIRTLFFAIRLKASRFLADSSTSCKLKDERL